jgi:hypothetical protein
MTVMTQAFDEQERIARKNLQTPVSFIGSYKMIMPMAPGGVTRWGRAARYTGTISLLLAYWLLVKIMFYGFLLGFLITAPVWLVYTLNRRHKILAARRVLAGRPALWDRPSEPPRELGGARDH